MSSYCHGAEWDSTAGCDGRTLHSFRGSRSACKILTLCQAPDTRYKVHLLLYLHWLFAHLRNALPAITMTRGHRVWTLPIDVTRLLPCIIYWAVGSALPALSSCAALLSLLALRVFRLYAPSIFPPSVVSHVCASRVLGK